jgi:hypothetical protein
MKFSTFIIIALLALIAYALLRPAPSPNAMQEFLRLAQQWIPPARTGGQDSQPGAEQPLPAPKSGGQGFLPVTLPSILAPKSEGSGNGKPSPAPPRVTWDPFAGGIDDFEERHYTGRVLQHLDGDSLVIRSGMKSDSGSGDQYVLTGFPGAADLRPDTQIEFSARSAGVVTLESNTETKTVTILVYSPGAETTNRRSTQNTQPTESTQPAKPGSWMWQHDGSLDRGPYNRSRVGF